MKSTTRRARALALVPVLAAFAVSAAFGQDDPAATTAGEPEFEGLGRIFLELTDWMAQPAGADLTVAIRQDLTTGLQNSLEAIPTGTEARFRYRVGYELRDNLGSFVLTWFATESSGTRKDLTPAVFQFGETNVYPEFPGVFDNGLADGYISAYDLKTRDIRLSYYRDFQRTKRVKARWFAGYRRFSHNRSLDTSYYALAPNLPPFLPPITNPSSALDPAADRGYTRSELSVRGIEAGLEMDLPIWRDRVWMETGLSLSVMRGRVSTSYESRTYFYGYDDGDGNLVYVDPLDGTSFDDPLIAPLLRQVSADIVLGSTNQATGSAALEGFLGFRYRAWRTLEVMGGIRSLYVDNASEEVVPTAAVRSEDGRRYSVIASERTSRGLTLEGYYLGLSFAF